MHIYIYICVYPTIFQIYTRGPPGVAERRSCASAVGSWQRHGFQDGGYHEINP